MQVVGKKVAQPDEVKLNGGLTGKGKKWQHSKASVIPLMVMVFD